MELPEFALLPGASRGIRRIHRVVMETQREIDVDQPHAVAIFQAHSVDRALGSTAERTLEIAELDDRHWGGGRADRRMAAGRNFRPRRLEQNPDLGLLA